MTGLAYLAPAEGRTDPPIDALGPLASIVFQFMIDSDRLIARAKLPDSSLDEWDVLTQAIATDEYQRVAANRDSRGWGEDLRLLQQFAKIAEFGREVRRVAEVGDRVYIDLIETVITKDDRFSVNTVAVVEFNEARKIRRKTTYQQWDRAPTHVGKGE